MTDLFDGTPWGRKGRRGARARMSDPETAHKAAESISDKGIAEAEKAVLLAIADRPDGATWKEQSEVLPKMLWQTISPRWQPLQEAGLIEFRFVTSPAVIDGQPTITKMRLTRPGWTGRGQTVWFATPKGEKMAAVIRALSGPYGQVLDALAH